MPRTPPPPTPAQQKIAARRAPFLSGDVATVRAWAAEYGAALLGDDHTVLISIHEARAVEPTMPATARRESIAWLEREYPASTALAQIRRFPGAFRGPVYGKVRKT